MTFCPSYCEFQDLSSWKTIVSAEEERGLYYITKHGQALGFRSHIKSSLSTISVSEPMLWHQCLGHPNFSYLKVLYTHLFINKSSHLFHSQQCILAKQTRSSHPSHEYKPTKPSYLVDSDMWGLNRTPNLTNTRWFITFIDDHTRISWVFDRTLTLLIEFGNKTVGNSLIIRFTLIAKNAYKQRKNKIGQFERALSLPRLLPKFS